MKPRLFLILVFLSFLIPRMVSAQTVDYVSLAIEALKTSNVYVAPGTPGTDYNTPSNLSKFLSPDDNIVLVMLPPEALAGTDMYSIAQKISAGLGDQKTIGLAIGREVIGYSTLLLEGVASDKMLRADSVSNDPVTALIIFTQNVHSWLKDHPLPTPTPIPTAIPTPRPTMEPIELPKAEDVSWPVWLVLLLVVVALGFLLNRVFGVAKVERKRQRRFNGLEGIRRSIQDIEVDVAKIVDRKIRNELDQAILLAYGLVDILKESDFYIGMTESLTPEMVKNMGKQVNALLRHESGRRPMSEKLYADLTAALLNYDALFKKLQEDDPDGADLIASVIHSQTTMISRNGYLED